MNNNKLSIITINFNNLYGVKKTIDSVLNQTFTDFEFIIIDGGSTDGSKEFIAEHSKTLAYWVSKPDNGIYDAMNKGIEMAKGRYILFLNSGDWLFAPTVLDEVFKNEFEADIIYGNLLVTSLNKSFLKEYPSHLDLRYLINHSLPHPAMFFKKEVFNSFGGYDTKYKIVSDWAYYFKLFVNESVTFLKIEVTVSCFDYQGISSREDTQDRIKEERTKIVDELLPKATQRLLNNYALLEQSVKQLKSNRLIKLCLSLISFKNKYLHILSF